MRKIILLVVVISFSISNLYSQSVDYDALVKKIALAVKTSSFSNNNKWVNSQNSNGSWSDLNYGYISKSKAKKATHLNRLLCIASQCVRKGDSKYGNANYKEAVKKGLQYWYSSNTTHFNWWYNYIKWPQQMGEILILMREFPGFIPLTGSSGITESKIISLFKPQSVTQITSHGQGANAVDISTHFIYRAALTKDFSMLNATRNKLYSILTKNIKSDLCYQDHGPQLQISSYGLVFSKGVIELAYYLSETPIKFDTSDDKFAVFLDFIKKVQIPAIRGRYWDFSVNGRSVTRNKVLRASLNYIKRIVDGNIDSDNRDYYLAAIDRVKGSKPADYKVPEFNRHYWNSDYTQHSRKNYLFTVRNVSTRVVECESGLGENIKGNYMSYGATDLQLKGNEYYNLMPVWDWAMVPGITYKHVTYFPKRLDWGYNYGKTKFVGGVSDGNYGVSTLDLNKDGVKAKKAWFMFDNEIVCLGAAVYNNSGTEVRTTINQCKLDGKAYFSLKDDDEVDSYSKSDETYTYDNLEWVRNGNVAYYFPEENNVNFRLGEQKGSWKSINAGGSASTLKADVFKLWINHGVNPKNKSYAYYILPNMKTDNEVKNYDKDNIEIIVNDGNTQAVYNNNHKMYQAVFYKAGQITHNATTIKVNKPCVLMIKNKLLSVADPTHLLSNINIEITVGNDAYDCTLDLPDGDYAGSSLKNINLSDYSTDLTNIDTLNIKVYPNPTDDFIYVSNAKKMNYNIIDMKGSIIMTGIINEKIDVSFIAPGIYMLEIIKDNKKQKVNKIFII